MINYDDMEFNEIELIDQMVNKKEADLMKYLQKENASQYFVDKMNKELSELIQVYNKLIDLEAGLSINTLKRISLSIAKMEEVDPELNGHSIFIYKSKGKNYSYFYIKEK